MSRVTPMVTNVTHGNGPKTRTRVYVTTEPADSARSYRQISAFIRILFLF